MPGLRLQLSCGARVEVHVVAAAEVTLGRGPDNDVILDHPSVDVAHARIAVRRDRVLVIPHPHGTRSVRVGRKVAGAPMVAERGSVIGLGDLTIEAEVIAALSAPPTSHGFGLGVERPTLDGARRFDLSSGGVSAELAWSERPQGEGRAWVERFIGADSVSGVTPLVDGRASDGEAWLVERIDRSVRLGVVLAAIADGRVRAPVEAAVAITAGVARALAAFHARWGAHGALDGRLVALGADGSVRLSRPGPIVEGWGDRLRRPYLAPERRLGGRPTRVADAWSLARIALDLGVPSGPWGRLLESEPERRPSDVAEAAEEIRAQALTAGLDPSTRHVAQLVDLVMPPDRPLAVIRPALTAALPA